MMAEDSSWFKDFGDWLFKDTAQDASGKLINKTPNFFNILGTGGALWSAYKKNEMANKMYDLQKDAFIENQKLNTWKKDQQKKIGDSLYAGFSNSSYY